MNFSLNYPIESIPKKIFSLKINLTNFKGEISDSLLGKISRSVDWLLKHSGLGRIDHCFLNEVFVYCIALKSVPTEKIQKLLSDDLIHLGILQTHITIN